MMTRPFGSPRSARRQPTWTMLTPRPAGGASALECWLAIVKELAEQTDSLKGHGDTLMDLAEVLGLAGQSQEAAEAIHQALKLYDQKGNLVLAAKARSLLSELT